MRQEGFILIQTLLLLLGMGVVLLISCQQIDEEMRHHQLEQEALQLESLIRAAKADCTKDETLHYPIGQVSCTETDKGFKMEARLENGQRIEAVVTHE